MTDNSLQMSMINQLRMKNIWKELQLINVLVMVIFVSSLLPSLLLRYVYTDPQMLETPVIFELIPVFSFVIGSIMFIYVVVTNFMREKQARMIESGMELPVAAKVAAPANHAESSTSELQAAMKSLSSKTDTKRRTKVVAAQRVSPRATKTSRSTKRKQK